MRCSITYGKEGSTGKDGVNTKTKKQSHAKSWLAQKYVTKETFNLTPQKTLICELEKRKKHIRKLGIASKSFKVVKNSSTLM